MANNFWSRWNIFGNKQNNPSEEFIKSDNLKDFFNKIDDVRQGEKVKIFGKKVQNEVFRNYLNYEDTRFSSYTDFELMEHYPEISAALDIFMEESTTEKNGKIINIFSTSDKIKEELETLFYDILEIQTSLPMWTRNTAKYGDNFIFLDVDNSEGIKSVTQLPVAEMERRDFSPIEKDGSDGNNETKFLWRGRNIVFNNLQIGHFRLLTDDRRLPYGVSILDKARRIWRLLLLAEDSMLIYRTTRAAEKKVFKVFVGNMDDQDVDAYVDEFANRFKRTSLVDPNTGQVDLRYNLVNNDQDFFIPVRDPNAATPIDTLQGACIDLDTKIPLMDGRELALKDIITEYKNGEELWAYSCNPKTGELVPGPITWAGVTRKNEKVLKITLDNDETITTTYDHNFLTRDGRKVEAQDLCVGDSLMPFYNKEENGKKLYLDNHYNMWFTKDRIIKDFYDGLTLSLNTEITVEDLQLEGDILNHKIKDIELVEDTMDVGTITIDGPEDFHDYHTFAVSSGIFIFNSNLSEIADIEYLQKKLFAALRVPKQFMGFEETAGEGKNLAMMDVRFARTINRIQQSMLMELNKIAIIHLYALGYEDYLDDFKLTLNNPSTQGEILKLEEYEKRLAVYRDATDSSNGLAPMSFTRAKKEILGMSDEDIILDTERMRVEKAMVAELEGTPEVIKKTGIFDSIDSKFETINEEEEEPTNNEEDADADTGGGGFGGGGGGFGGGGDLGGDTGLEDALGDAEADAEEGDVDADLGGDEGLDDLTDEMGDVEIE